MGTTLDGLKKLYKKMSGTKSKATTTAEALDEIAESYTKSDAGTNAMTALLGGMSETSGFISDTSLKYTANIDLGEVNQLYVSSGSGTTFSTVFRTTGSGHNRTGTLFLPIIYPDASEKEIAGWFKYTATSKLELNDEGEGGIVTTFTPVGTPTIDNDRVAMKFVNFAMNRKDISLV